MIAASFVMLLAVLLLGMPPWLKLTCFFSMGYLLIGGIDRLDAS